MNQCLWQMKTTTEKEKNTHTRVLFRQNYDSRAHLKRERSSTDINSAENLEIRFFLFEISFLLDIFFSHLIRWYARYDCIFFLTNLLTRVMETIIRSLQQKTRFNLRHVIY